MNSDKERYEYFRLHEKEVQELKQLLRDWQQFGEDTEDCINILGVCRLNELKDRTKALVRD